MKGGVRARSGPAPDPGALRREGESGWVTLPADGREGAAPTWPLASQSDREELLWAEEWKRPQAVMWERNGQELEVALYIRSLIDAEARDAVVAARTLVRQQQEALGLSQPGLARNRWKIEEVEAPAEAPKPSVRSTRSRLKVVTGGAA